MNFSIQLKNKRSILIFLVVHSLLCILNQVLFYHGLSSDSLRYIELAKQYASANFFDCYSNCYGHPFYSFFLLLLASPVFYNVYMIGLIQSLLFGTCCVLLLSELERLYKKPMGGLLLLVLLVPEFQIFNGYVLTESPGMSLMLLCFALGLRIVNKGPSKGRLLSLSFFTACSILNRFESAVVLLPLFYLLFPLLRLGLIQNLLLFISIPVFFLLINCQRNFKTYGRFYPGTFNGGEVLYGGNNPRLDGSHHDFWKRPELFFSVGNHALVRGVLAEEECRSCPQRHDLLSRLAMESWKTDAWGQISAIPLKLGKNWLLPGFFDIYTADLSGDRGLQLSKLFDKTQFGNKWYAPVKHAFYLVIHWLLLGIVVTGIFKIKKHNRFEISVLILLILFLLFAIPFCGLPRWHLLVFPLLIITYTPQALQNVLNVWFNVIVMRLDKKTETD